MLSQERHSKKTCLSSLLAAYPVELSSRSCQITGLALDSRKVEQGNLFFAYPGLQADGREFIQNAIDNGAAAVLAENVTHDNSSRMTDPDVPIVYLDHVADKVGDIAANFYDYPTEKMSIIGVTGTNGKSTVCHLLAQAYQLLGTRCAVMGTLGNGVLDELLQSELTTADPLQIQQQLSHFLSQEIDLVAMEVSSHSLSQWRVGGIDFDVAVFTNLTRDHLDYHGDLQTYANEKKKLFLKAPLKTAVINIDDDLGQSLAKEIPPQIRKIFYGTQSSSVDGEYIQLKSFAYKDQLLQAQIDSSWGSGVFTTELIGDFNLSNLLAVIGTLLALNVPFNDILSVIPQLKSIAGRMQACHITGWPLAIIDYAHTPDALEQVLKTLRSYDMKTLWCVFGCGGDRDRGKRAEMAKVAECYADRIIITDDNPRYEDPENIVADIVAGFSPTLQDSSKFKVIHSRADAIQYALENADERDIVVIAGKGHETYQQIADNNLEFSDVECVMEILKRDKQ